MKKGSLFLFALIVIALSAMAQPMDMSEILFAPSDSLDTLGYPEGYFYIIQGSDTFCVEPYLVDAVTESLWFSYSSSSMHTGVEEAYKSKAFFYYNSATGRMGLLVVHNIDDIGTTNATCEMYFIDLPLGTEFAVSDDPSHAHTLSTGRPCGSAQEFNLDCWPQGGWQWGSNTDGGGMYLPRAEWKFSIHHTWGGTDPITSWWFLSGDAGDEEIPLSMTLGDTLYLGHGFLELLPYPTDYIFIDSVTTGIDTTIEIVVHNSDETIDTLYIGGIDNTDPHFSTLDFPDTLGPDDWGTISLAFFSADTGMFCDTVWARTNEPCGSNPIVVCVHATAPPVEAEIIEPLPDTWTSCADQQITMTLESGGEQTIRMDIPSNSTTTEYWDTTSSTWKPAVNISYSGWWTPLFEGSSWIWDSVYTGAITGRRLTFRTLIETDPGAEIDSAFISWRADNSAIVYMNGDSIGTDDDGATWHHMFTFDLLGSMHGGVDTLEVIGIDLTGVAVGLNFMVSVFYRVDCDLDLSSIEFSVDDVDYTLSDPSLEFVAPNYLLFTPSPSEHYSDGDTVTACLNNLENFCDGYLTDPLCWDFYVDLTPPHIDNTIPVQDTFIADPLPTISADILDFGSGVDESTIELTVAGAIIDVADYAITSTAGGFNIEYTPTTPIMASDTIWACISATDTTDYCPDNVMDTCWFFFNMSTREVWFPTMFGPPCDTVLIPLEIDGLDFSWIGSAEFVFSMDTDVLEPIGIVTAGALTNGWGVSGLDIDLSDGTLTASIAGSPLSSGDGGDFLYLEAVVPCDARGGSYTYIYVDTLIFNSGVPLVEWTAGLFAVELSPRAFSTDIRLNRTTTPTDDYTLTIAALFGGSDDYDPGLDIQRVPPPVGLVAGYFPLDDPDYTYIEKLMKDVRAVDPPVTWHIITEGEPSGVARWDPARFPEGEFRMNGLVDMKRDSIAYFGANDTLVIEWYMPELGARLLDFEAGWNLVSSPLLPEGIPARQVFNSVFDVFRYNTPTSAYGSADFVRDGEGYWVWADDDYTVTLIGSEIESYRRQIHRGWNLIGTTIDTIDISEIEVTPAGSIIGDIFGWDGAGYFTATELIPGDGYWLLSNNSGVLSVPSGARRRVSPEPRPDWLGRLIIGEDVLEIGLAKSSAPGLGIGDRAIPPTSPDGTPVNYALIADGVELTRDLTASSEWELLVRTNATALLELPEDIVLQIGEVEYVDGEVAYISAGVHKLKSRKLLPETFEILGAVPNPFNSATEFAVAIPKAGEVKVEIFDISGREVRKMETDVSAGIARIRWNGEDDSGRSLSSGLYLARITFDGESAVVKSMFIK